MAQHTSCSLPQLSRSPLAPTTPTRTSEKLFKSRQSVGKLYRELSFITVSRYHSMRMHWDAGIIIRMEKGTDWSIVRVGVWPRGCCGPCRLLFEVRSATFQCELREVSWEHRKGKEIHGWGFFARSHAMVWEYWCSNQGDTSKVYGACWKRDFVLHSSTRPTVCTIQCYESLHWMMSWYNGGCLMPSKCWALTIQLMFKTLCFVMKNCTSLGEFASEGFVHYPKTKLFVQQQQVSGQQWCLLVCAGRGLCSFSYLKVLRWIVSSMAVWSKLTFCHSWSNGTFHGLCFKTMHLPTKLIKRGKTLPTITNCYNLRYLSRLSKTVVAKGQNCFRWLLNECRPSASVVCLLDIGVL